jgi:hypothetical protein
VKRASPLLRVLQVVFRCVNIAFKPVLHDAGPHSDLARKQLRDTGQISISWAHMLLDSARSHKPGRISSDEEYNSADRRRRRFWLSLHCFEKPADEA